MMGLKSESKESKDQFANVYDLLHIRKWLKKDICDILSSAGAIAIFCSSIIGIAADLGRSLQARLGLVLSQPMNFECRLYF